MEWKLSEERYKQYSQALTSAQETEANLGSLTYKLYQLNASRASIDQFLKTWWDEILVEMKLDTKRNYMITREGVIQDVTPEKPVDSPVTTLEEVKVAQTVSDLT